jgi:FkbM family methyltransferase
VNRKQLVRVLNRPGVRWASALGSTLAETLISGSPTIVKPLKGGIFAHRHRDATLVLPNVANRLTPAVFEADARDIFCFGYVPVEGDNVLDVGAGCGEEAITFSRMVGRSGRVVSIEAHAPTFARLVLTCELNNLRNVFPLHVALADSEAGVRIDDGTPGLGSLAASIGGQAGSFVPSTTIDRIVQEQSLERIDLLKMNIEGAEQLAIHGMKNSIDRIRNVAISCHDFLLCSDSSQRDREWFGTYDKVYGFLRNAGFRIRDRRSADARPWVQYYIYASRK